MIVYGWLKTIVHKKWVKNIFFVFSATAYLVMFLWLTLFCRRAYDDYHYQFEFLWEWRLAFGFENGKLILQDPGWAKEIFDNFMLFVPMGIFLSELIQDGRALWWRILIICAGFSSMIELTQLFFRLGLFEYDDIFGNTIGGMIGFGIFAFTERLGRIIRKRRWFLCRRSRDERISTVDIPFILWRICCYLWWYGLDCGSRE